MSEPRERPKLDRPTDRFFVAVDRKIIGVFSHGDGFEFGPLAPVHPPFSGQIVPEDEWTRDWTK